MSIKRELAKFSGYCKYLLGGSPFEIKGEPVIAANLICHNNVSFFEPCLKSLREVVDEIIVIDGGSTDGTIELLEKYDAKIIINKDWQGWTHQRNLALAETKSDWIIKLDTDEFLSPQLQANLRELCRSKIVGGYRTYSRWVQSLPETKADLYSTEIKYVDSCASPKKYYKNQRLFRNLDGIRWRGQVHESIYGLEECYKTTFTPDLNYIYHLDVAINPIQNRFEKALSRNQIKEDAANAEEYLPELFDLEHKIMPNEDKALLEYLYTDKRSALKQCAT